MAIDFDAASLAWRGNKRHMGNGHFRYICYHPSCGNLRRKSQVVKYNLRRRKISKIAIYCQKHAYLDI